ncbi:MRG family protein [Wolffia australiana]
MGSSKEMGDGEEGGKAGKGESAGDGGEGNVAAASSPGNPSAGSDSKPRRAEYEEGEKVLAFHGPRIYESKVQKVEYRDKEWKYYVHYLGWNKSWDEWVESRRLLKFTEENVEKQKILNKNGRAKSMKSFRSTQSKPKASNEPKPEKEDPKTNSSRGKKRKGNTDVEEDGKPSEKLVTIQLPLALKKQLIDDWDYVTQQKKLVKLPRSPNVDDILKKYLEHRAKKDGMIADSVGEILKGIRCYFDKALFAMLLYKNEREQYNDAIKEQVSPSSIYGAEHLLRLFVKLPELLTYVRMEDEALSKMQQRLSEFLKFLQKNQSSFFLSAYEPAK